MSSETNAIVEVIEKGEVVFSQLRVSSVKLANSELKAVMADNLAKRPSKGILKSSSSFENPEQSRR